MKRVSLHAWRTGETSITMGLRYCSGGRPGEHVLSKSGDYPYTDGTYDCRVEGPRKLVFLKPLNPKTLKTKPSWHLKGLGWTSMRSRDVLHPRGSPIFLVLSKE